MEENTIVKISIEITDDGTAHSMITCGKGRRFQEVLDGLISCRKEIDEQIKNRNLCPFSRKIKTT